MSTRRLPVYFLLDTSGSMKGEPIESLKVGLQSLVSSLRQDPHALESVHLCLIAYDRTARVITPLTSLEDFQMPLLACPDSGPTHTGQALEMLCACLDRDLIKSTPEQKGDWRPMLFVMTDGSPSDIALYNQMIIEMGKRPWAMIVACAAGAKARKDALAQLTPHVVTLDTMDGNSFAGFFKWVSATVSEGNRSMGAAPNVHLPPPPPEIQVVV